MLVSQREIERQWERALAAERPSELVRSEVRRSWSRSLDAHVDPTLPRAPAAMGAEALVLARARSGWFGLVEELARSQRLAPRGRDYVLTIFDADGMMLSAMGDPWVRGAMDEINFSPGALWAEHVVGTNGPGTALASRAPVHILGAEHFCRAWHPWQCAAVPLSDPLTGRLLGAIDVSGPYREAHPHTLDLVRALGLAVEQTLLAEGLERRLALLELFADEHARRPGDELAVIDASGLVVRASPGAALALREGQVLAPFANGLPDEATLAEHGARVALPLLRGAATLGWLLVLGALRPPRSRAAAGERPAAESPVAEVLPLRAPRPNGTRYQLGDLVGRSPALLAARRLAEIAAGNTLPVLLLGESGVGKEVLAQSIHAASRRHKGPFVAVNCGALPRELVESELFGYAPGSFTGARRDGGLGRFEAADGGTLFLDEIGELPVTAQSSLLRALQEGEIARVGSTVPRRVDVRVIAATQRRPSDAVRDGTLRSDLYYRLAVLPCELPPLRARREDIPLLVDRFLDRAAAELGRPRPAIDFDVWPLLAAHDWPGNVRELENLVRRLVATTPGRIGRADLPAELDGGPGTAAGDGGIAAADDALAAGRADRDRLLAALAAARTLGDAARSLGIGRSTLYRWMARYGIEPRRAFGPRRLPT